MVLGLLKKFQVYGPKRFFYFAYLELMKMLYWQPIKNSYSQNQEDLKIDEFLNYPEHGLYVDVGAYDPDRFSNTKRFYQKNWRGINIEPDEYSFNKFLKKRPDDVNLNIGVADQEGFLVFYKMDTQTLSTFDFDEAQEYQNQGYKILEEKKIPVKKLETIFDEYVGDKKISFLSVDTEGFDMHVLKSNNWQKYKPLLICIESVKHSSVLSNEKDENQEQFLINFGYKKVFDNGLNSIYLFKK